MKTKAIMAAILIACNVSMIYAQTMIVNLANGSKMEFKTSEVTNVEFKEAENKDDKPDNPVTDDGQFANGHEYVDLGLPSGTLWATMNVGANAPEEFGNYYAWGETKAYGEDYTSNANNYRYTGSYKKTYFCLDTYKWFRGDYSVMKYNLISAFGDNKGTLELADDAANVNWGENWRMPTREEQTELCAKCYWVWTTSYNGKSVSGYIVYKQKSIADTGWTHGSSYSYSLSDAHIFLPAAGYRLNDSLIYGGFIGEFWSSSASVTEHYTAYYLSIFTPSNFDPYDSYLRPVDGSEMSRDRGLSVRPVRRK